MMMTEYIGCDSSFEKHGRGNFLRVMVGLSCPLNSSLQVKFCLFGRKEMGLGVVMISVLSFSMCNVISGKPRNPNLFLTTPPTPEIHHHVYLWLQ